MLNVQYFFLTSITFNRVGADHGQEEANDALDNGINPEIVKEYSNGKVEDETTRRKYLTFSFLDKSYVDVRYKITAI